MHVEVLDRRHLILQLRQLVGDVVWEQIPAGRQELAELDVDGAEILSGKSPTDPEEKPDAVSNFYTSVEFEFFSENGVSYQVEWSTDLETWTPFPEIIKGSRKRRIAAGCGLQVQDVNRLIKQQMQMKKMMKKMSKGGMAKMMRAMKGGGMPPGMGGPGGMGF